MPVELVGTTYVRNSDEWVRETEIPGTLPHAIETQHAKRSWKALALLALLGIGEAHMLARATDPFQPDVRPGVRKGIELALGGLSAAFGLGAIGFASRARRLSNLTRK